MSNKAKILIVDDDGDFLFALKEYLREDYEVMTTESGYNALKLLQSTSFDLILLDIMMPTLDGYGLVQKMKEQNIDIPFIFITAKDFQEDKIKGFELGAEDYVTKPFSQEELYLRVNKKLLNQEKINIRNKRLRTVHHNIIDPINGLQGFLEIQASMIEQIENKFLSNRIEEDKYLIFNRDVEKFKLEFQELNQNMSETIRTLVKIINNYEEVYGKFQVELYKGSIALNTFIYNVMLMKPKKLQCKLQTAIPDLSISIDANKLYTVCFELLDNAALHNDSSSPMVEISIKTDNQYVYFYFKDNARGIQENDFQNVFQEFWNGYNKTHHVRGNGLGLWICKKYLHAHQGDIWVENSNIGHGTTFTLSLPINTT